jgi:hypothetical protein
VLLNRVPGDFFAPKRPDEYVQISTRLHRAIAETAGSA